MKNKLIGLLLGLMMVGGATAQPLTNWDYAGKQWVVVSKNSLTMTVVGVEPGANGSIRSALLAHHWPFTYHAGSDQKTRSFDYALSRIQVDCGSRGSIKYTDGRSYFLGREAHAKDTYTKGWEKDTFSENLTYKIWKSICDSASAQPLPKAVSHDQVTQMYREEINAGKQNEQTQSDQKKQHTQTDQVDLGAATKSNLTPQTDLAWARGGEGHHWHYALAADTVFLVVDVHRVTQGQKTHLKKMARVSIFPETREIGAGLGQVDYIVEQVVADCNTKGAMKTLASAFYKMKGNRGVLAVAAKSKDANGDPTSVASLDEHTWDWACKGDQKINAIPSNISFDEMRKMYLDSF